MNPPDDNSDFSWLVYADFLQDNGRDGDSLRAEVRDGRNHWSESWISEDNRNGVGCGDTITLPGGFDFYLTVRAGQQEVGAVKVHGVGSPYLSPRTPGVA